MTVPQKYSHIPVSRLRAMCEEDFARYDSGNEGLYRRFYDAARTAASVDELLSAVKTKRYAYARLRRMLLAAYLDVTAADVPPEVLIFVCLHTLR